MRERKHEPYLWRPGTIGSLEEEDLLHVQAYPVICGGGARDPYFLRQFGGRRS